jgi:gamma-glutamylcyclotransferase (GGCT)/AIG2-like uncharacterized protein YtfP
MRFREHKIRKTNAISRQHQAYQEIIEGMKRELAAHRPEAFAEVPERLMADLPRIEGLYVLDGSGVMLTDNLFRECRPARTTPLFREAQKGDNLSQKEYFYLVMFTGLQRYVTDSYISWATGNLTRTISSAFRSRTGEGYVLCIDVREDGPGNQDGCEEEAEQMKHLFAYGTLMCGEIMEEVAGVLPPHGPAILSGYSRWAVQGESYPAVVPDVAGRVEGVVYQNVPDRAWERLDRFEGEMYVRQAVQIELNDGRTLPAETYVARPAFRARLDRREWRYSDFLDHGKAGFQSRYQGYRALASD